MSTCRTRRFGKLSCWLGKSLVALSPATLTGFAFYSHAVAAPQTYTFAVTPQFEQRKLIAI
jgi:hypothetical protein